jgi:hypothetical protein
MRRTSANRQRKQGRKVEAMRFYISACLLLVGLSYSNFSEELVMPTFLQKLQLYHDARRNKRRISNF